MMNIRIGSFSGKTDKTGTGKMAEGLSGCNGKDGYTDDLYKGGGRGHRIHRRRNGDGGKFPENRFLLVEKEKRIWREPAYSRIFLEMMYGMDHFGANRRAETLDIWCGRRMSRI